ncbi:MAG: TIGR04222 domain-containing membrane protein [Pirellula sp.]
MANLPGPIFLMLYIAVVSAAAVALRWMVVRGDLSRGLPPLPLPSKIDPFQIAFLRGGENEVLRAAMVDLVERGWIEPEPPPQPTSRWSRNATSPARWRSAMAPNESRPTSAIHSFVLEHFQIPATADSLFKSSNIQRLDPEFDAWRRWSEKETLLTDSNLRSSAVALGVMGLLLLEAFGAWKLVAAAMHHRSNIGFLIALMGITPFVLLATCRVSRLTRRGKDFLRDVQTVLAPYRAVKVAEKAGEVLPSTASLSFGDVSIPLLAMGAFGVDALQGSSMDPLFQAYRASATTASGCSAASSSIGCGSGSAGGDGGSGCGGGGGCGGCGGGGCGS